MAKVWNKDVQGNDPCMRLDAKLRELARALAGWSSRRIGNIREQLMMAEEVVLQFDTAQETRQLTDAEFWLRCELKKKILGWASLLRIIARQRSLMLYLREGEASASFFHINASKKRRKNHLFRLSRGDSTATNQEDMEELASNFFIDLIGSPKTRNSSINLDALHLPVVDLAELEVISRRKRFGMPSVLCRLTRHPGQKVSPLASTRLAAGR